MTSSAERAVDTANIIGYEVSYPVESIQVRPTLYLASADEIFEWLKSIENQYSHVWLVGHNPALTELASSLCGNQKMDYLPTCAFYRVEFGVDDWSALVRGQGREIEFDFPKSIEFS